MIIYEAQTRGGKHSVVASLDDDGDVLAIIIASLDDDGEHVTIRFFKGGALDGVKCGIPLRNAQKVISQSVNDGIRYTKVAVNSIGAAVI